MNSVNKKGYIKPEITKISLDNTITLLMASQPKNPPPRGDSSKGSEPAFQSPFEKKPFG